MTTIYRRADYDDDDNDDDDRLFSARCHRHMCTATDRRVTPTASRLE